MSDMVIKLLGEQRKRLIASVLGGAEQSAWWKNLSIAEQRAYRDKVLESVGVFSDFARDVLKVSNDDMVRNEHAITLLQQVHDSQRRVERAARSQV